ncbi:MAG: hypothetical protein DRO67_00210 [Candidatus Asgardarchaeum californiense]|nr:MAG: hypothetical protein DRO67_00210 [Candidatus Asgardarchaeum californiense]
MKNGVIIKVQDEELNEKINEGVTCDREIKRLQLKLTSIKEDLEYLEPGKYMTPGGNTVTISESAKYSEISPEDAKQALRSKRLGKNFLVCVKVVVKCLKRYLSDEELNALRRIESYTRRYSFK